MQHMLDGLYGEGVTQYSLVTCQTLNSTRNKDSTVKQGIVVIGVEAQEWVLPGAASAASTVRSDVVLQETIADSY